MGGVAPNATGVEKAATGTVGGGGSDAPSDPIDPIEDEELVHICCGWLAPAIDVGIVNGVYPGAVENGS